MKKIIIIALALASFTAAQAQNSFAIATPVNATVIAGVNSNTPTTGNVLTLSGVPGGTSAIEIQTLTTPLSNTVVALSIDFRLSLDNINYSDALTTATVTATGGTNSVNLARISCNGARYAKVVSVRDTGTNSATTTIKLGQFRP